MIKLCARCYSTWAGGTSCEDCGAELLDPFSAEAQALPEEVWRYIRLQYGARRGMIVRVLAILLGGVVFGLSLRKTSGWPWAFGWLASAALGLATWRLLHVGATRAVRLWVLRRGRVRRVKLARALLRRALH